jgi:hypothetical protein
MPPRSARKGGRSAPSRYRIGVIRGGARALQAKRFISERMPVHFKESEERGLTPREIRRHLIESFGPQETYPDLDMYEYRTRNNTVEEREGRTR